MKKIFFLPFFFSILYADELSKALQKNKEGNWTHFDFNLSQKPKEIQSEEVDFQSVLNSALSGVFEKNNGIDNTEGSLDFENENFQMKNLTSLYEGENDSLLFQKEIFVSQESYNYSGGLINRYSYDDFLLGVNGFIDKQKEEHSDSASFGSELGYANILKAYTNYYMPEEAQRNLQLGLSFAVPNYKALIFDISKDNEKTNYQISYKPYNVFSLNLLRKNYKADQEDETAIQLGFNFNLRENFFKQFKKTDNTLEEINRYDFFQRTH